MAVRVLGKNKYQIELVIGYNGAKKIRHFETFIGTKKEAVLFEHKLKLELKNNTFLKKNSITVEELVEEWLSASKSTLSPKTYYSYKNYCKNIINSMGHIKLQNLSPKLLEEFYRELRTNTDYADKTILHHYTIISAMLNKAVVWDYILMNPNSKVERPKVRKTEVACYTPEDVNKLVEVLKNESLKYQAVIFLAIDSGCRRSEITGLTWDDVDFEKCTININKSTQYVKELGVFEKSTKSDTSVRTIYVTPTTINVLKQYRVQQLETKLKLGDKWENSKRVFTTDYGADMHPDTPSLILKKIIKKHKLPHINFHGLRHTSISLQIASGIQVQIISKRAGHSNITVTHNTYSHFFDSGFKEVANRMDDFLKVNTNP